MKQGFSVALKPVLELCRPGYPQTQISTCLCLLCIGIKGMCHHPVKRTFLKLFEICSRPVHRHELVTIISLAEKYGVKINLPVWGQPSLHRHRQFQDNQSYTAIQVCEKYKRSWWDAKWLFEQRFPDSKQVTFINVSPSLPIAQVLADWWIQS